MGRSNDSEHGYVLMLGFCPYQPPMTGTVEPMIWDSGKIEMFCESCSTVWASVEEFRTGDGKSIRDRPTDSNWGSWRHASAEDVADLGVEWTIVSNWRQIDRP